MKEVALIADVESMYCRVRVMPQDEEKLRFLSWDGGNLDKKHGIFCMTSHVFGAKSSACIAGYAIQCAINNATSISEDSASSARKKFYVDDFLCSAESIQDGIRMAHEVTNALKEGGFRLTKWLSNKREVIESFPIEERADAARN